MLQASDGYFYGSTSYGGSDGNRGTLFRMAPAGAFEVLKVLTEKTGWVESDLIEATDGNFYGTSSLGGENGDGAVFRLSSEGVLTELASFYFPTGRIPSAGVIQASDGNFYGTTEDGGIYRDPLAHVGNRLQDDSRGRIDDACIL